MKKQFFLSAFCTYLIGCTNNEAAKEALVQKEIAVAVNAYREQRLKECQENIYEKANKIADSILITRAKRLSPNGSIAPKPVRPVKPTLKEDLDSVEVKPLLQK
ncbi:MAG: hypothetical protein RIS64_551 [Bacteroidota bacterium]|jgi:hypothetical protein